MRWTVAVLVFMLMVLNIGASAASSPVSEGPSVRLFMVSPAAPTEHVMIQNDGLVEVDLNGLTLTDGEGTLTFNSSFLLGPNGKMAIVSNLTRASTILKECGMMAYGSENFTRKGSFALADDGDQVWLSIDGAIIDRFCYGDAIPPSGWDGVPFPKVQKGHAAMRVGPGSSADDWRVSVPGRSDIPSYGTNVSAAILPIPGEGATTIASMITAAARSIRIAVYTLDDLTLATRLGEARQRGVRVEVLLEANPVGGISDDGERAINMLTEDEVDVKLMFRNDSYKRYDYVHCKYAIFDSERCIVSSENLGSGLIYNRGWCAVIESEELAAVLEELFNKDRSCDHIDIKNGTNDGDVAIINPGPLPDMAYTFVSCPAELVISPDNSLAAIIGMIDSARERLYLEQLSFNSTWMIASGIWRSVLDAAERGVEVRILLDSYVQGNDNQISIQRLQSSIEDDMNLEIRLCSPYHEFGTLHNKGLIADDEVLVSSINMVRTAFQENREVGVRLMSRSLSDQAAEWFWDDWSYDPVPPVLVIDDELNISAGGSVLLDASRTYDNAGPVNISWDMDGDGAAERYGLRTAVKMPAGVHTVIVTATDPSGNSVSSVVTINVAPAPDNEFEWLIWAPAAGMGTWMGYLVLRKTIKWR